MLDYVAITGQRSIKISLYGLFQAYRSTEEYPRFMDALREALKSRPDLLLKMGFEIVYEESREGFLITNVENLRRICEELQLYGEIKLFNLYPQ